MEREHSEGVAPVRLFGARNLKALGELRDVLRDQEVLALSEIAADLASAAESLARAQESQERSQPVEWMTAKQAASYVKRSETAFSNIVAAGGIPKHYLTERGILFNRNEVDDWLMGRTSPEDCL